jgi:(S)-ureidoglycine aminohydrolase
MTSTYYAPQGGLPDQHQLLTDRAMFTEAYAVIPRGTMSDIVTSYLPNWTETRLWVLARPLSGFAETSLSTSSRYPPAAAATCPRTIPRRKECSSSSTAR